LPVVLRQLQLRDGSLRLDDRLAGRVHTLDRLNLVLPFLSTRPADAALQVAPRLSFRLNGSPVDAVAQAAPFATTRPGTLDLTLAGLDLAPYGPYLPAGLPVQARRAVLDAALRLSFAAPAGRPPTLALSGWLAAHDVALADATGAPLLAWQQARLTLRDVRPLDHQLGLGTLRVDGLTLDLARAADGRLNLQRLLAAAGAQPASPPDRPWTAQLDSLDLQGATVRWVDHGLRQQPPGRPAPAAPAWALTLADITLGAKQLAWPMAEPAELTLRAGLQAAVGAARLQPAGALAVQGRASAQHAAFDIRLDALSLGAWSPYLQPWLVPRLSGQLTAQGRLTWAATGVPAAGPAAAQPGAAPPAPAALALALSDARFDALRLTMPGQRDADADLLLPQLSIGPAQLDLAAHRLTVARLRLVQPRLRLARDADGGLNLQRWLPPAAPLAQAAHAARPAKAAARPMTATAEAPWTLRLDDLALSAGQLRWTDALAGGGAPAPDLLVSGLDLRLQGLAWPRLPPVALRLAAQVAPADRPRRGGGLQWTGRVGLSPGLAQGRLQLQHFPVALFAPYAAAQMPLTLQRAEAGFDGSLLLRTGPQGLRSEVAGDLRLDDVLLRNRPEPGSDAPGQELLSWQSLALDGLRLALVPEQRPQLAIRSAALADFYAQLVVSAQGRFNLQAVAAVPAAGATAGPLASAAPLTPTATASTAVTAATAVTAPAALPIDLSVDATRLSNGRVDFTDHFIRPNYSVRLSELSGSLGAFRSGTPEMAALDLRGRAAGTATLAIVGQVNPTANPPAMDLRAQASDLELAPLTPYSGKYAGYAIERGKLSADLHYRISPGGQLAASNQLVLNQLTFGERVDSPTATSLPVRLAVALLKDRNGVIDINLPVSGSLQDPQFSVGRLIWQVIVNLLTRAVTAPFSLLAGAGAGLDTAAGGDLSQVGFEPGSAQPTAAGRQTLDKLAHVLADRPAVQMTVVGMADLAAEAADLRRLALDTRLRAERQREQSRAGAALPAEAPAPGLPALTADERLRLVPAVYQRTALAGKPRNLLGLARDVPVAQMEAMLLQAVPVNQDTLRELALQRGLAVRDALVAAGLPGARLFLGAPQLQAAATGEGGQAWTPRAQLVLSQP